MKIIHSTIIFLLAVFWLAQPAAALEVDRDVLPRITLGGRAMATIDSVDLDSDPAAEDEINIEDSNIMVRFDKRLYDNGVAGAVFGIKEHDRKLEFSQMQAFFWNGDFEVRLGRTRLPNTLIEFPLIRDEDMIELTHVGNGSSNEEFGQIYGETVSFSWFPGKKGHAIKVWTGTRANGDSADFPDEPDGFDSVGGGYVFEQGEDLRYVKWIRHAGILVDKQDVATGPTSEESLSSVIAGIEFNLNMNPVSNWSMAVQAIQSDGLSGVSSADLVDATYAVSNRARAKSDSLVTSIRYTSRPNLLTRWQAALTVGVKDYNDVNNAKVTTIAPSLFYRLGNNVDLLAQYRKVDYDSGLGDYTDNIIQVGLAFGFNTVFNDNIGERDSILNLEHGYIQ